MTGIIQEVIMETVRTSQQVKTLTGTFIQSVYMWMAAGLALTGFISYYTATSAAAVQFLFGTPGLLIGLFIAEIAMVVYLSARIHKMSATTATAVFVAYAALNGITISGIFLAYTMSSIATTFLASAGTFLAMTIYGMTTKKDLTSWGSFLFMGLIGIIIASVVNMFIKSGPMGMIISYIGVIIFTGMTAYDTQKIKEMALTQPYDIGASAVRKASIMGALQLYLDFINLFLMLLRIMGDRD